MRVVCKPNVVNNIVLLQSPGMGCLKQGVLCASCVTYPCSLTQVNYCSQPECNSKKAKSQLERQGEQGE